MSEQSEAMRLIQHMNNEWQEDWDGQAIRAELHRLHGVEKQRDELLEALQFVMTAHGEQLDTAFAQAQDAIAKATGETK